MWRSLAGENGAARETSLAHDSETCRHPYHGGGERRWRKIKDLVPDLQGGWTQHVHSQGAGGWRLWAPREKRPSRGPNSGGHSEHMPEFMGPCSLCCEYSHMLHFLTSSVHSHVHTSVPCA